MSTPKLLLPTEYVKTATKHIEQAKHHVFFLCMMMTDDLSTNELIEALASAARRGVEVEVAADVFTYGEFGGHFIPLKYYTKKSRATTSMAKKLTQSGVKFTWLGRFSTTPFSGRTHVKCLIVDDTAYSFGGVNLDDHSLDYTDYMFQCTDNNLAIALRDDLRKIIKADGKHFAHISHSFPYEGVGTVLMDRGFQGNSIIYRRACQLAAEAVDILY
ncbi:MAG: phospholipase D-like domain-containing protein, partial [Candidatus Saccharimonadales bacterium]